MRFARVAAKVWRGFGLGSPGRCRLSLLSLCHHRTGLSCVAIVIADTTMGSMIMSLQGKNETYFSTAEAAKVLGIKETSIRMSVHRGSLVPIKIGQALVFSESELARYKKEVKGRPGPKK